MSEFRRIAVTGGPCAGKTTGLVYIGERLLDLNIQPIFVPEVATILFSSGVTIGNSALSNSEFQRHVLRLQLALHHHYVSIADNYIKNGTKVVHISDRGAIDSGGYISWEEFRTIVEEEGYNIPGLSVGLYDGVIHLDTAPEEFYTNGNNPHRKETWEQAILLNEAIKTAWLRTEHPHFRIIDNENGFEAKLHRFFAALCRIIGIPVPLEIERRFLIELPNFSDFIPFIPEGVVIQQIYLKSDHDDRTQRRIRRRTQDEVNFYFETRKQELRAGVRLEEESRISPFDYVTWTKNSKDPYRDIIEKRRYCLLYKNQYFEIDVFINPERLRGLVILEIELTEERDHIVIPPFIKVIREITDNKFLNNSHLALKNAPRPA